MLLLYDKKIEDGEFSLSADQSHHCLSVLRMAVGEKLLVSNGFGDVFDAEIIATSGKICTVAAIEQDMSFKRPACNIHLALAPTKNFDRVEWAVEKAVEIGVTAITPLLTSRCERRVVKLERLEKIVTSAASQSLKSVLPTLHELTDFNQFVAENKAGLIAHCNDGYDKIEIPKSVADYTILIGPEGDFSPSEVDAAIAAGYRSVTLGEQRLRTETAAIYAVIASTIFSKL